MSLLGFRVVLFLGFGALAGCTSTAQIPRKVFDLPPCRGTWICDMDRKHCECTPRKLFEEWAKRNLP